MAVQKGYVVVEGKKLRSAEEEINVPGLKDGAKVR